VTLFLEYVGWLVGWLVGRRRRNVGEGGVEKETKKKVGSLES